VRSKCATTSLSGIQHIGRRSLIFAVLTFAKWRNYTVMLTNVCVGTLYVRIGNHIKGRSRIRRKTLDRRVFNSYMISCLLNWLLTARRNAKHLTCRRLNNKEDNFSRSGTGVYAFTALPRST
jgi:hypothetical protein